ncbi:pentatricopeptide repeat-containing protein At4g15720-like [Rhodamnia argentea]|uniref:Pentatricopeptide repeat-containing protein At4g15720-like n=1 Tax=Rhodamnia argentea TaxID=178133 RepID=A0A8B8NBR2_9MYRT|nr:pentatricopeptide repeat-containing protein At4g15720-like [Rhodamnia argentea]
MKTTSFMGNLLSALKNARRWRQNQLTKFHSKTLHAGKPPESNDFYSAFSIHTRLLKSSLLTHTTATNHLINRYAKLQEIEHARRLFDELPEPNVVSWTSLMAGYIGVGRPEVALWLYGRMRRSAVLPNEFALTTVANACSVLADLRVGRGIHAHVEVFGLRGNVVVCSSLVDMYGKCNEVDEARRVFDSMSNKNIVSWTSMITAYAQSGKGKEALHLFWEFDYSRFGFPNHFMLASVVNACSSSGSLVSGRIAHGAVIRYGYDTNDVIASALMDMYAKCGYFNYCEKVFRRIENPSVVPYTSMIVGAAKYGLGMLSLELLEEMIDRGVKPNDVTFLGIPHACSHSGLVDDDLAILESMDKKYGIIPDARHYTCVVDMLGRIGRLDKAYELAKSIQVRPEEGALLWGTLLSASRLHGQVEIATEASNWLIKSNQQLSGFAEFSA